MKPHYVFAGLPALACLVAAPSFAVVTFDQNVTPEILFGDGTVNGGFTLFQDATSGLEIGLRAKLRYDSNNQPQSIYNSNADGSYTFQPGLRGSNSDRAEWSYEWSVNTDYTGASGQKLNDYTYQIILTGSPSTGVTSNTFDPINGGPTDHGIGTNSTAAGQGDDDKAARVAPGTGASYYADLLANNNVGQNSWQPTFGFVGWNNFDPEAIGVYTATLKVFDGATEIGSNSIDILVPEPASAALLGLAGSLMLLRRRA